ncbi:MAG: dihydrodipicolinate synthase family protein [Bryobacterales bacterium]|nr:dihydrodipicolinate synthase family protein [Bryobacterales bacterium]
MSFLRGVIPLLQTPFHDDGALDLESLAQQTDWVLRSGVTTIAYPGFVSEWWKLTPGELLAAAGVIRRASSGRARLVLNVTAQATRPAVEQALAYAGLGADALMVLPPFIVPASNAAILDHLGAVLAAVPLPHVLQYSSSLTGLRLDAREIVELHFRHPHLCSIKIDCIPPGPIVTSLKSALPGAFTYLIGYAGLHLDDALRRGAHGMMPGAGHVHEDLRAFTALQSDAAAGLAAFHRLLPLLNLEMQTIETSIALHKLLLFERGVIGSAHVRAPGSMLDDEMAAQALEHLRRLS